MPDLPTDLQLGFEVHIGSNPTEHSIKANGKPFNFVTALGIDVGSNGLVMAHFDCYLEQGLEINEKLAVNHRSDPETWRKYGDAPHTINIILTRHPAMHSILIDGELYPFTYLNIMADTHHETQVIIRNDHDNTWLSGYLFNDD